MPTPTDLERIARAICKANNMDPDAQFGCFPRWNVYVADARAAVEAMMTVSDAACEAGYKVPSGTGRYDNRKELIRGVVTPMWQAMCRAILDESDARNDEKPRAG